MIMKICMNCFTDSQIRKIIERSSSEINDCDFCLTTDTKVCNPGDEPYERIKELLNGLVGIYQIETTGTGNLLRQELVSFWHIFNIDLLEERKVQQLLINLLNEKYKEQPELFNSSVIIRTLKNKDYKQKHSMFKESSYSEFVDIIQTKHRFHIDQFNSDVFGIIIEYGTLTISSKEKFYRARLCRDGKVKKIEDMGAPESKYSTPGRANPKGISHLYLASEKDIAVKEIRVGLHDEVSIAKFHLLKDIIVVDIEELSSFSPFLGIDYELYAINKEHIREFQKAMLHPVKRDETYFEYLPTQYFIDYIKKRGFNGIRFPSTMDSNGYNLVLFDSDLVEGDEEVEFISIKEIDYIY